MIDRDNKSFQLDDWKSGDSITAAKLQQPVNAIKALAGGIMPPRQVSEKYNIKAFYGIVTQCDKSSGFAKVQKASGVLGGLTIIDEESDEIIVFTGKESNIRVGNEVYCMPNPSNIKPGYTAFKPLMGLCYEEPDAGDLCEDNEDPDDIVCTTCCDETVTVS